MFLLRQEYFDSKRYALLPGLKCPVEKFIAEWTACQEEPTRETSTLFSYLQGNVDHWVNMLVLPTKEKDISYCSLINKISHIDPIEALKYWTHENRHELDILLSEVWFMLLRNQPFEISKKPSQHAFILSRLFVYKLSNYINAWLASIDKHSELEFLPDMDVLEAPEALPLLQDVLIDLQTHNPYGFYLVSLFLNDLDRNDMYSITKTKTSYVYLWRILDAEFHKRVSDERSEHYRSASPSR